MCYVLQASDTYCYLYVILYAIDYTLNILCYFLTVLNLGQEIFLTRYETVLKFTATITKDLHTLPFINKPQRIYN